MDINKGERGSFQLFSVHSRSLNTKKISNKVLKLNQLNQVKILLPKNTFHIKLNHHLSSHQYIAMSKSKRLTDKRHNQERTSVPYKQLGQNSRCVESQKYQKSIENNGEVRKRQGHRRSKEAHRTLMEAKSQILKINNQNYVIRKSRKNPPKEGIQEKAVELPQIFAVNKDKLRKRKKQNTLSYKIVNLFEQMKKKINSIRQKQASMVFGMDLNEQQLENINSCGKSGTVSTCEETTVEKTGKKCGQIEEQSPKKGSNLTYGKISKSTKKNKVQCGCFEEEQNDQNIRPWSIHQI